MLTELGQLQLENQSTQDSLKHTYETLNNRTIDEQALVTKLQQMSKIGLTHQEIRNVDDDPVLVWKTRAF